MGAPNPQDHIIVDQAEDGWTYRYAAPPTEEDGTVLVGYTYCCNRPICAPNGLAAAAAHRHLPYIDDCCERPFVVHGAELPPYSGEHATCPKCGSKAVETRYQNGPMQPHGIKPRGYPAEWLARRCAVCQAKWDEACVQPVERDHHCIPCPLCEANADG